MQLLQILSLFSAYCWKLLSSSRVWYKRGCIAGFLGGLGFVSTVLNMGNESDEKDRPEGLLIGMSLILFQ